MLSIDAYEVASNPEVTCWLEDHPQHAGELTAEEIDELYSLQGMGGPLTAYGVEAAVQRIERRRLAVDRLLTLSGTHLFDTVDTLLEALHAKIHLYVADPKNGPTNDPAVALAIRQLLDGLETAVVGRRLIKPVVSLRCAEGLELLCVVAPTAVPTDHVPILPTAKPAETGEELSRIEKALQLFMRDPNQSVRELARKVPCSPALLYGSAKLRRLRQTHAARLPRGSKSKDGQIEAAD